MFVLKKTHDALNERFKKAVTDLAAATDANQSLASANRLLTAEVASLRPDALAMRRKRRMDRDRKAAKKEGGK